MAHGDNLVARLQKATGNPAATLLLYRLLYWHKNGKGRQIDGQKWVANSIADWMEETGLTFQQVRTALKVIEEAHLAETKVAVYATRQTLHSRPTQRAEAIAEGKLDEIEDEPACYAQQGSMLPGTSDLVADNKAACCQQHAIQGDNQGETKEEDNGEPCSSQVLHALPEKVSEEGEKMDMMEALKAGKEKTSKLIHKPDSVPALARIWKEKVSEATGAMIGLKEKEIGQLKLIQGLCPKGKAAHVLGAVLDDWVGFAAQVKSQAGVSSAPAYPSVGFLLQHASIAVIFTSLQSIAGSTPKPKEQEAPQAQVLPKLNPVQSISHDEEQPATYEELVALSKGL